MRRAVPAAIATLIGLLALLSFKSSPGVPSRSIASAPINHTTPTTAPPRPGATAPPSTAPATGAGTAPPTDPPATAPPTTAGATRTIDGDAFDNFYGTVQVEVKLQGSRIVNVTELQMPQDRQRSAEISQQAAPLLEQEVMQAQSAQIDIIGGATYTSQSYAQSLQSALDKATR